MSPYVLVVDDDPDVRRLIGEALTLLGLDSRSARNGQEAIREVEQELPSAIVLDLMMPVMDGFSTLAALRRTKAYRGVPVIVMSALVEADQRIAGFPGVVGMIQKGQFDLQALRSLLTKAGVIQPNIA